MESFKLDETMKVGLDPTGLMSLQEETAECTISVLAQRQGHVRTARW